MNYLWHMMMLTQYCPFGFKWHLLLFRANRVLVPVFAQVLASANFNTFSHTVYLNESLVLQIDSLPFQ